MKTLTKPLLAILGLLISLNVFSQDDAKSLVARGVALNDSGKYAEALATYQLAIKANPHYSNAYYEYAYTLFVTGKGTDAVPYLEKVIKLDPTAGGGFDMLGSIYDDNKQPDKAIEYYRQGIKVDPDYQRLHFNLAVLYLRQDKNKEAEACAIDAIKLDPKHASSQRVYALATYNQNRFAPSIMAFCSFLLLEPQSQRSNEAFGYIQKIIQSRVKINADSGAKKSVTIYVQDNKSTDEDERALEMIVAMAAATPTLDKNKNKTPNELLTEQLETIFKTAGELSSKRKTKDFFWKYYADYFYKLAQSENMPAFTRLVSLSAYKEENIKWFNENDSKLKDLNHWVSTTDRNF